MTVPRWAGPTLGGFLLLGLAALVIVLFFRSCERERDVPGQRADSVLADTVAYVREIAAQDSTIARLDSVIRVTDRERARWKHLAQERLRHDDALQAAVDSTVAAGVPDTVAPAVFWKDQWERQRRITAGLRDATVPALLATIAADSVGISQRDSEKLELESQRDFARMRARQVTAEFARYRNASKPGIDLGLFRAPEWVREAIHCLPATGLTAVAGALVDRDDRPRGAVLAGGSTLVGCIAS